MGIEYTLRTTEFDRSAIQVELLRLSGAGPPSELMGMIEYRRVESREETMPDAVAQVEANSIYFRDNGGCGRDFLGAVVAALCAYGPVTVEEL